MYVCMYVCMYVSKKYQTGFFNSCYNLFFTFSTPLRQLLLLEHVWTGVTNQQAEMVNSTWKSNDGIYNRADSLKSDSN